MADHAQVSPVGPSYRWSPTRLEPPPHPQDWVFIAPPGWPSRLPAADYVSSLPAPPPGHVFWRERWGKWPAFGSLITGVLGVTLIGQGTGPAIFFGLVIVACVIAAGWVSKVWFAVKVLPVGPKTFVWTVAIPGIVSGICFLWLLIIHSWGARRSNSS